MSTIIGLLAMMAAIACFAYALRVVVQVSNEDTEEE